MAEFLTYALSQSPSASLRWFMMRGGPPQRFQRLMRLRVLMQFFAIVVTMSTIWTLGR